MNDNKKGAYGGPERRQCKRIRKPFVIRFRQKDDAESGWSMVTAKNLSATGAIFPYDKPLPKDSFLDLKINFPGIGESIECMAKTVRFEKYPNASLLNIAVMFTDIAESAKNIINETAESFYLRKADRIEP